MHDMLGVNLGRMAKFVHNFLEGSEGVKDAFSRYVRAVKEGAFPDDARHAW
ncbi:3-methyl-2-oxobutanoate hydroxymethyltransferase [compost metagenome]